jgi:hypothetical protein
MFDCNCAAFDSYCAETNIVTNLAEAQSSISGVQVSAQGSGGFLLYDNNTGRLWAYDLYRGDIAYWGRVKELGKPLVKDLPAEKQ